jgi:hypothetical protein
MKLLDFLNTGETPICLTDAAKLLPAKPNGKRLSLRAIERYIRDGYGPDDAKVFLEGAKAGNILCTSREALQRFIKACTEADQVRHQLPTAAVVKKSQKPSPTKPRGERASRARRELASAGFAQGKKK